MVMTQRAAPPRLAQSPSVDSSTHCAEGSKRRDPGRALNSCAPLSSSVEFNPMDHTNIKTSKQGGALTRQHIPTAANNAGEEDGNHKDHDSVPDGHSGSDGAAQSVASGTMVSGTTEDASQEAYRSNQFWTFVDRSLMKLREDVEVNHATEADRVNAWTEGMNAIPQADLKTYSSQGQGKTL